MNSPGAKPDPWRKAALAAGVLCLQAGIALAHAFDAGDGLGGRVGAWSLDVAPLAPFASETARSLGGVLDLALDAYSVGPDPLFEDDDLGWMAGDDDAPPPDL
jgi:hypothetical protein